MDIRRGVSGLWFWIRPGSGSSEYGGGGLSGSNSGPWPCPGSCRAPSWGCEGLSISNYGERDIDGCVCAWKTRPRWAAESAVTDRPACPYMEIAQCGNCDYTIQRAIRAEKMSVVGFYTHRPATQATLCHQSQTHVDNKANVLCASELWLTTKFKMLVS